eukprot:21813-Eustigmatos_ZCMA.PRE.1
MFECICSDNRDPIIQLLLVYSAPGLRAGIAVDLDANALGPSRLGAPDEETSPAASYVVTHIGGRNSRHRDGE